MRSLPTTVLLLAALAACQPAPEIAPSVSEEALDRWNVANSDSALQARQAEFQRCPEEPSPWSLSTLPASAHGSLLVTLGTWETRFDEVQLTAQELGLELLYCRSDVPAIVFSVSEDAQKQLESITGYPWVADAWIDSSLDTAPVLPPVPNPPGTPDPGNSSGK